MTGPVRRLLPLLLGLLLTALLQAEHVVISGGPSLRRWEDLRVQKDQHDRWWANFIRGGTLRIDEIRRAYGPDTKVVWLVHQRSYEARGREDGKPYTTWIRDQAAKRRATLIWFNTTGEFIQALNARPRGSIQTLDYFGHSNKYAFMFDYGSDIMAASTSWLHERDLPRIRGSIFARNAECTSWGCHTGESMSEVWKRAIGVPLAGVRGPTHYGPVGQGQMPAALGPWSR
jgi:hypothetical protein